MAVNERRMRQVLTHIAGHLGQWDQSIWGRKTRCGTTACLAGWAHVLHGAEIGEPPEYDKYDNALLGDSERIGAEVLGLSAEEAGLIFFWSPNKEWIGTSKEDQFAGFVHFISQRTGVDFTDIKPAPVSFQPSEVSVDR